MHVSALKVAALSALLPISAYAFPLGPRNDSAPFYLKPAKDQGKVMAVYVGPGRQLSGGALVSIEAVDAAGLAKEGTVYNQWQFVDYQQTQLKLVGTEFCLDATAGNPASFTQMKVWPCQSQGFLAQMWNTSAVLDEFADGSTKIKPSIDEAKQCLDWKDGSTDIAQTYTCEDGNTNQHWIKTNDKRFAREDDGLTTTISSRQASQSAAATATFSTSQAEGTVVTVIAGQDLSSLLGQPTSATASMDDNVYLSTSTLTQSTGSLLSNRPHISSTSIASSSLGPAPTTTVFTGSAYLSSSFLAQSTASLLGNGSLISSTAVVSNSPGMKATTTASCDVQFQPGSTGIISSLVAKPSTVTVNQGATTVSLLPSSVSVVADSPASIVTIVNESSAPYISSSILAQDSTVDAAGATSTAYPSSSLASMTQTVQ